MADLKELERIARSNGYWLNIEPFAARLAVYEATNETLKQSLGELERQNAILWDSANDRNQALQRAEARLAAAEAVAAADGTLHGAIDHWQERAKVAEARLAEAERVVRMLTGEKLCGHPFDCICAGDAATKFLRAAHSASAAPTDADLLDFGYAPGNYESFCLTCNARMSGVDKRCHRCRPCAVKNWRATVTVSPTSEQRK